MTGLPSEVYPTTIRPSRVLSTARNVPWDESRNTGATASWITRVTSNDDPALTQAHVVGGTAFFFARDENVQTFDWLFVDEAGNPADVYLEGSRAWVRVMDVSAAGTVDVQTDQGLLTGVPAIRAIRGSSKGATA